MLSGSRANLMTGKIAHVLETFDTLEVGRSGYERVLNVVTDLPISAGTPGFDAEKLHALAQELGKLLDPGDYARSTVRYKGNAPGEVIAKAEQRLEEADKQHARIKADPEREVARERLRVKRAKKEKPDA
jgi:hypothetical protein